MPEQPKRQISKQGLVERKRIRQPTFMKNTLSRKAKEQQPNKGTMDNLMQNIHGLIQCPKSIGDDPVANAQGSLCQLQTFITDAQKLIPGASEIRCLADLTDLMLKEITQMKLDIRDLKEKELGREQAEQMSEFHKRKKQEAENNLQLTIINFEDQIKKLQSEKQELDKRFNDLKLSNDKIKDEKEKLEKKFLAHTQCERVKSWVICEPEDFWDENKADCNRPRLKSAFEPSEKIEHASFHFREFLSTFECDVSTISCANSGTTINQLKRKNSVQTDISFANSGTTVPIMRRKNSVYSEISMANSSQT